MNEAAAASRGDRDRRPGRWGWLARAALAAALAVFLVTAAMSFMKHVVYPIPAIEVGAPPPGFREVVWTLEDGVAIHGWHGGAADPARPVMLFFHGNAENLQTLAWAGVFDRMAELGVYGLAVEYPGYGKSGGTPSEPGLVAGGTAALDWARSQWPKRRVVVAGWSLGAAVAVQVAASRPDAVDGLALMSGWTRIHDVGAEHFPAFLVRLMVRDRYDSLAAAADVRCPSLVVHGGRDSIIPPAHGERLAAALEPRSRWLAIADAGHNDLLARDRVWNELAVFIGSLP